MRRALVILAVLTLLAYSQRDRLAANLPLGPGSFEPPPGGRPILRIAALSDTHIQDEGSSPRAKAANAKLSRALRDHARFEPALYVFNGDVTDNGSPSEYRAFSRILKASIPDRPFLVTTGNHEFYSANGDDVLALERFCEAFGLSRPYRDLILQDVHIIMLADERWKTAPRNSDWAWLSDEQLNWFAGVLPAHRDKLTIVFLHQTLNDTVVGSSSSFSGVGQANRIREVLDRNPQVRLWFSGHTHRPVTSEGQAVKKGNPWFFGLGSTFYTLIPPAGRGGSGSGTGGFEHDFEANMSRLIDIYADRVVVRVRDHREGKWLGNLEVSIPR